MKLYRGNKKILTHTISEIDGDFSSEIIELGEYEIIDSNFILYTYWAAGDRMGKNIYPYGFRKQIYSVNIKGIMRLKSSKIYIEAYVDEYNEHKGMKYLRNKPKTDKEFELMKDYTSKAEKMYFGNFVFGKNKLRLENEVRDKIGKRIMQHTKDWRKIFAGNCRM